MNDWQRFLRFCLVGASGYAVNLAVYGALLQLGVAYLLAASGAFLVAVANNYGWNRLWTFRDRRAGVAGQGIRFLAVSLAALAANLLALHLLVRLGVGKIAAQAAAIALATPLNFVGNARWTFGRRARRAHTDEETAARPLPQERQRQRRQG